MDDVAVFSSVLTSQQRADLVQWDRDKHYLHPLIGRLLVPLCRRYRKDEHRRFRGTSTTLTLSSPVSAPHNFIDVTGEHLR
jgi:hypothetical protein